MVTTTATKRAVGYFRVSSTAQAGEHHSSLPTQESRFREYCHRNSLVPIATFTDTVTGRTKIVTERDKAALAEKLPQAIRTFLEDLQNMDIRQQKAHLQTILKAAHIYRDGRIELEFRQ